MESQKCSARLCGKPAANKSPITCQPLCSQHLEPDLFSFEKSNASVAERISYLRKYANPLKLIQQRLDSDLQLIPGIFEELHKTIDKCLKEIVEVMTRQRNQARDAQKIFVDLDCFEKEFKEAIDRNDLRQAFLANDGMEKSLANANLDSDQVCMDGETQMVKMVTYPDVNYRIRNLHACLDFEMQRLLTEIDFLHVRNAEGKPGGASKKTVSRIDINGDASRLVICNNTRGFVIDKSGKVAKAQKAPGGVELSQPCVFVTIEPCGDSSAGSEGCCSEEMLVETSIEDVCAVKENAFRIRLICVDSKVSGALACNWEANLPIRDLHCDDNRQLLYIAQERTVTITDFSGLLKSKLGVSDLNNDAQSVLCVFGDVEKLYVLTEFIDGRIMVLGLSKESQDVQLKVLVPTSCNLSLDVSTHLRVRDRMMMIFDRREVATVCSITGLHISSESLDVPSFQWPTEDKDFDEEILPLSACQTLPRMTALTSRLIPKYWQALLLRRSPRHYSFLYLEDGKAFVVNVQPK